MNNNTNQIHQINGREGFLDDTNKTEVEKRKEIEIQTGVIDNNPVKLHKDSYEKNKARIESNQ